MFKSIVIGNLGADAQVKESNGSKFVTFRVAHTESYTDQAGQKHESTTWIDCIMSNAESKVVPYLKKGTKVYVSGNCSLRVFSSAKYRQMMAGAQNSNLVNVEEAAELTQQQAVKLLEKLATPESHERQAVLSFFGGGFMAGFVCSFRGKNRCWKNSAIYDIIKC